MRLASEMVHRGARVSILAINDRFIHKQTEITEAVDLNTISCLRIPHQISNKEKLKITQTFVQKHNPEWISLQYVPFSFNDKGIPYRLTGLLKQFNKQVQWHIMFHELWIGTHGSRDLKMIFWKCLQKLIIRRLIYHLQPKLITTSIKKYLQLLNEKNTQLLPLFGNIPQFVNEEKIIRPDFIKVVIYGSVTSCLDEFRKQILWLKKLSLQLNRKISFVFIGNNGINKYSAEGIIKNEFGASSQKSIGFVSKDTVSCHLTTADLGISRADYTYLGKSGTTITMLEHGLPVLLKGKRPLLTNQEDNNLIQHQLFYPDDPLPTSLIKYPKTSFLQSVTDQYIQLLHHASGK